MLKPYDKYENFDDIWIEKIPYHWNKIKMKYFFYEISDKNHPDEEPLVASQNMGVVPKSVYGQRTVVANGGLENFKLVKIGDFVISLRSFQGGLEYAYYQGIISPAYTILRCKNEIYNQYFRLLAKSIPFISLLKTCVTGIREGQNIDYNILNTHILPIPPLLEQKQIVSYLNWKTAQMDYFVQEKEKEKEDLKELKIRIINDVTTQGINKKVIKKKSSALWMGKEIPIHWEILPSKRLFALRKEKAYNSDIQLTASQKYGIVSQEWFMKKEGRRVTVVIKGEEILKHVEKGDFVISMRSFQGGIEYSDNTGKISSAYVMLIPDNEKVYAPYFKWLLKSRSYIKALRGTSDLVRDGQALRYSNFAEIYLPLIPLDEQRKIAEYIDKKCIDINNAIENIDKEISLINELRTRTIADVVTGKVDVRNVKIPEEYKVV